MTLSPIDVQQKTFRQAFKGYDGGEVDEFLDEVVISLREFEQKLREAEDRVAILEDQLRAKSDSDDSIKRAFLSAQKAADDLVEGAKVEADGIIARAREEATALTEEQASEKATLLSELDALRSTTHELRARLQAVAAETVGELSSLAGELDASVERFGNGGTEETSVDAEPAPISGEPEVIEMTPMSAFNRAAPVEDDTAEWTTEDLPTEEVPTLRRPWERGTD